jgi:hypothetical protein
MKIKPLHLLLRHCLTLGEGSGHRPPAHERLEQALGPELARRLVVSLASDPGRR